MPPKEASQSGSQSGGPSTGTRSNDPERIRALEEEIRVLRAQREESVATVLTEGGTRTKRSAKVDEPPRFYHDPDKDELPFPLWLMQMNHRVTTNRDWFPDEEAVVRHFAGRLGGQPAEDIIPYVDEENESRITTIEGMKRHLKLQYDDADRRRKAQAAWDDLRMMVPKTYNSTAVNYQAFKNAFIRLAEQLGKPLAGRKEEFERRLSPELQKALVVQLLDDHTPFDRIVELAQHVDYTNRTANAAIRARKEEANAKGRGGGGQGRGGYASKSKEPGKPIGGGWAGNKDHKGGAGGAGGDAPRHSREKFEQLMREGRCMRCEQVGHRAKDCPQGNRGVSALETPDREARLAALYRRYGGEASAPRAEGSAASNKGKLSAALEDSDSEN